MSFTTTKPAVGDPTKQSFASAVIDNDTELRDRSITDLLRSFGDMEDWSNGTSSAPDQWTLSGAGATIARDGTNYKIGTYSAAVTRVGTDCQLQLDAGPWIGGTGYYRSRVFTLGAWVRATVASRARIAIDDGVATQASSYHTGGSSWEWLTVSITADAAATQILTELHLLTGNTTAQYDGVTLVEGTTCPPASSIRGVGASGSIVGTMIAVNTIKGTHIALGSDAQGDVMFYNGTDWARLAAGTSGQFFKTQGAGANPLWAGVPGEVATGNYNGDDTVNRAIAHGMSQAPKIVLITTGAIIFFRLIPGDTANIFAISDTVNAKLAVTARDATSFYVGNATSYANSANASGNTYYWIAIA
ncbi:MAG: hypothetical protein HYY96_01185 [Candidatus Tectomicrobia bacterium]|nr:hypothetical protein [Candidatus Tectomicrobia bacterium]